MNQIILNSKTFKCLFLLADALVETLPSHSLLGNAVRGSISSDSYKADIELPGDP